MCKNGAAAPTPVTPVNIVATGTPTFKVPSYQDFNISVQHELMHNTVLEVGYVGTKGHPSARRHGPQPAHRCRAPGES